MKIVFAALALLVAGSSFAAPPTALQIDQLIRLTEADKSMDAVKAQFAQIMDQAIKDRLAREKALNEAQKAALERFKSETNALLNRMLDWKAMEPDFRKIYADTFTAEEIQAQIDFYRTASGQSIIKKMPALMTRSMEVGQQAAARAMPELQTLAKKLDYELSAAADKP